MNKTKIVIVDYGLGNLFSVKNACEYLGLSVEISDQKTAVEKADALILPGVGAYGDAMQNLITSDLVSPIRDFCASGKPFMGVCLGMQLLFTESEEFGVNKGLGIIEGTIRKFPKTDQQGKRIKVPQITWNKVKNANPDLWVKSPLKGLPDNEFMYFVHSYYVVPEHRSEILSETDYMGISYCSGIIKNNIFATQFHPEKSGIKGIEIYKKWSDSLLKQ